MSLFLDDVNDEMAAQNWSGADWWGSPRFAFTLHLVTIRIVLKDFKLVLVVKLNLHY